MNIKTSAQNSFLFITDLQYRYGIIGINEYEERLESFHTLLSDTNEDNEVNKDYLDVNGNNSYEITDESDENIIHLVPLGLSDRWVFTIGDPDPFPSIPHGHLNSKNQAWPKLNPYTGWVYSTKSQTTKRLTKRDMRILWSNEKFRQLCYDHVSWFICTNPDFELGIIHKLRFPKWNKSRSKY